MKNSFLAMLTMLLAIFMFGSSSFLFADEFDDLFWEEFGEIEENFDVEEDEFDDELNFNWGYSDTDEIVVSETTTNSLLLESPIVYDLLWDAAYSYKVNYSKTPISEMWTDLTTKEFLAEEVTDSWVVKLSITDLEPNTEYYFVLIASNISETDWDESKEFKFKTDSLEEEFIADDTTENISDNPVEEKHGSAWDNVSLKNISYSYNAETNKVTLFWDTEWDTNWLRVDIYSKLTWTTSFKKVDSPKIWDKTFVMTMLEEWTYDVKLVPVNSEGTPVWNDYIQKVEVEKVTETVDLENPPKVWPESIYLIWIMTLFIILYTAYRVRLNNR